MHIMCIWLPLTKGQLWVNDAVLSLTDGLQMKNDDQREPRNLPFNPPHWRWKISGAVQALTPSLCLRHWINIWWLDGLLSCICQIIWLQCMQEKDSMYPCPLCLSMHLPGAYVNVPVLFQLSPHISCLLWILFCSSAFFILCIYLYIYICFLFFGFFLLRLKEQQAVTAPQALTDHSPQSGCQCCRLGSATSHRGACEWSCSSGLMCSTLWNSPLLCSVLVTLQYVCCLLLKEAQVKSRTGIYLKVWIFGRLILDMNCDDNTALLVDNCEDALAGSDICLSQDILNKSHHGCSDIWSMPCCYGTFGNSWDYWGNSLLSSTTLLHS